MAALVAYKSPDCVACRMKDEMSTCGTAVVMG